MVLEEGSNDVPLDDNDAYNSGDATSIVQYKLNPDSYPRPLPILGPFFGFTTARQLNRTGEVIEQAAKFGRPPSQEQAEAIAEHVFKALSIASYGPPIGIGIGLYRAYKSAATFRWPFYQPKNIAYSSRSAVLMHIGRGLAYSLSGWFWGMTLVGSYASSVFHARLSTDPRLRDIVKAMNSERLRAAQDRAKGKATESRHTTRPVASSVDDASPTGSWESEGYAASGADEKSSTMSAPMVTQRSWPQSRPLQESQDRDNGEQPFDAFEAAHSDAEPGLTDDKVVPSNPGSAWDRIRRGEKPVPVSKHSNESAWAKQKRDDRDEQGGRSGSSDSFSYSKAEEERSYARDEAQRDFDARVERERQGGDFSKGNRDQKR